MSGETNTQAPKRTLEQVEQANRARARAWFVQHPMMSDDEFERRYDPQGYRDRLLIQTLEDLTYAVRRLAPDFIAQPERAWRPARSVPAPRPLSGPIDIQ